MIQSTTEPHKRVLLISYAFPPVGGAGVQRMLKFTKYLPDYGWLPTVLTVANPSVPVTDPRMLDEVPKNVEVVRARTLEPNYRFKSAISNSTQASHRNGLGSGSRIGFAHRDLAGFNPIHKSYGIRRHIESENESCKKALFEQSS